MSAMNAFLSDGAAHLFTDGAGYDFVDGRVGLLIQKTAVLAPLSAAIATRGTSALLPLLAETANQAFHTFEALVDGLSTITKTIVDARPDILKAAGNKKIDVVLAGFSSRRDRAEIYWLGNWNRDGVPAWTLSEPYYQFIAPVDADFLSAFKDTRGIDLVKDELDPFEHGIDVMQAQRERKWDPVSEGQIYMIGGFCQHTIVTRESITTSIVRRWPDAMGEVIAP